jgi:Tol biopolymer transport system component
VQADFDNTRPQEAVDKMITSPDKKRIAVVYHKVTDYSSEYRIDMYSADGKLLHKATSDTMAVHLPDTIVWSPDSSTLAFVAMIRLIAPAAEMTPPPAATPDPENPDAAAASPVPAAPTPAAPTGILTFRSEQIYTFNADGAGTKALTQNEGLIYFYYGWSPDSSMLVAMAATVREWKYLDVTSAGKGEALVPQGRLRIIEKNGRERRIDDNLTAVRPVWSPDSTKVAAAFETQVRIYDAVAINPTQAAIPLKNQLLISSQAYDRNQQRMTQAAADANVDPNTAGTPEQPLSTLPDEKLLVSYNPIVEIAWTAEDTVYLQTAYLKRMRNEAENVRSFARWHRLIFTAQPTVAANK